MDPTWGPVSALIALAMFLVLVADRLIAIGREKAKEQRAIADVDRALMLIGGLSEKIEKLAEGKLDRELFRTVWHDQRAMLSSFQGAIYNHLGVFRIGNDLPEGFVDIPKEMDIIAENHGIEQP